MSGHTAQFCSSAPHLGPQSASFPHNVLPNLLLLSQWPDSASCGLSWSALSVLSPDQQPASDREAEYSFPSPAQAQWASPALQERQASFPQVSSYLTALNTNGQWSWVLPPASCAAMGHPFPFMPYLLSDRANQSLLASSEALMHLTAF